jgi:sulfonate transport system ATP-binding protein
MALTNDHPLPYSMPVDGPVASVRSVRKRFGDNLVLDDLDLEIGAGEFVAMLGRSGSGKSTLLRGLAALEPVEHGSIEVRSRISVAFQEPRLLPWKRVGANIEVALEREHRGGRAARAARTEEVLGEVGLADKRGVWPRTLSGGQAQRVSLARALAPDPGLLLLDEPFSALDALTRMEMHRLVLRLWEHHRPGVLLVTHDVDEALLLADRIVPLTAGPAATLGPSIEVGLPRPRDRRALNHDPRFKEVRRRVIGFLLDRGRRPVGAPLEATA